MDRIRSYLLLSFLFVIFSISCNQGSSPDRADSAKDTIKLGLIVSLSGPAAEMGKSWLDGALLAESELKREGFAIELVIDDDQTLAARAVSAYQKQVRINKVQAVIGGTWDFLAESLYPLAAQTQIPFLTPSNPIELIDPEVQQKNPWVFTNGLSVSAEGKAIEPLLRGSDAVRSAALLYPELPWGHSHAQMFRDLCQKNGVELLLQYNYQYESELDSLRSAALQISRYRPELVYAPISASAIDVLSSELRRLKLNPLIVVSQHLHSAAELVADSQQISRVIGVYPEVSDQKFQERFEAFHGRSPRVFAEFGYDALKFMALALKAGVDFAKSKSFEYRGLTGLHRLTPESRALSSASAQLFSWQSGSLKPYRLSHEQLAVQRERVFHH